MLHDLDRRYFFDAGLRFACQRCGRCCTGAPGRVVAERSEAEAMAAVLGRPLGKLVPGWLIPDGRRFLVRERQDGRCVFYDRGCRVYAARPVQCRTYPFWLRNLRSEAAWRREAARCPGIGTGRRYRPEEILDTLARDRRLAGRHAITVTGRDRRP